jgi:hypothetical protein
VGVFETGVVVVLFVTCGGVTATLGFVFLDCCPGDTLVLVLVVMLMLVLVVLVRVLGETVFVVLERGVGEVNDDAEMVGVEVL